MPGIGVLRLRTFCRLRVDCHQWVGTRCRRAEERYGFSAVSLSGSGRLLIEQGETESLTITADDNLLPHIKSEVSGGRLELGSKDSMTNLRPSTEIIYKLTVTNLQDVDISGSGTADIKRVRAERLKLEISGSGRVSAAGGADDLQIEISGSGGYQGDALQSKRAGVDISGSGSAVVAVSDKLDVEVSGSGSVAYIGDPQVHQEISGSGSVRKR
jgi:hypothetical protein